MMARSFMGPVMITNLGLGRSGTGRRSRGAAGLMNAGHRGVAGATTADSAGAADSPETAGGVVIRRFHGGEGIAAGMVLAIMDGGAKTAAILPTPGQIFIIAANLGMKASADNLPKTVLAAADSGRLRQRPVSGALIIREQGNSQPDNGRGWAMFPAVPGMATGVALPEEPAWRGIMDFLA